MPPDWLHTEMKERQTVLYHRGIERGDNILEIGCGAHALSTVPLAFLVGDAGHVLAVEKERWNYFHQIVSDSGMTHRIDPVCCDAQKLPISSKRFDAAVNVHGVRSLKNEETIVRVLSEMFRVAQRIFIAESLPVARTKAQAAHLEMYNLREEIFEAILGSKDDIHYLELDALKRLVVQAGGKVKSSEIIDIDLPHYLAFIPRAYVEKIRNPSKRADILSRWDNANDKITKYGDEHPPVGAISAEANEI